jgi:hypothetical protein
MAEVDSILEGTSRKIWNLPNTFPRAGLHAPPEELGLNIPTVWEDYRGSAIRSWTQVLNDKGALGVTAMASYTQAAQNFKHWPLEPAFHTHIGHTTCASVIGKNYFRTPKPFFRTNPVTNPVQSRKNNKHFCTRLPLAVQWP